MANVVAMDWPWCPVAPGVGLATPPPNGVALETDLVLTPLTVRGQGERGEEGDGGGEEEEEDGEWIYVVHCHVM